MTYDKIENLGYKKEGRKEGREEEIEGMWERREEGGKERSR